MINTNYGGSNYLNSVNTFYKYNYNKMTSTYSNYNTAGVEKGKSNFINTDGLDYLQSIRTGAKDLLDSLGSLTSSNTFNKMRIASSNEDALSINSGNVPQGGFSDKKVSIEQIASAQVNKGIEMKAGDKFDSSSGQKQFEIEIDGKRHQISVDVKAGDTNKAVQQKMADAINSKNLGVTASVSTDKTGKLSTLSIQSKNTGDSGKNTFSLRDVSGSLVSNTGAATTTQKAQNAIYSIDGGEKITSQSNQIELAKGVTATLKKETGSNPVTVSAQRGGSGSSGADALQSMVDSYNKLLSASQKNGRNDKLSNELLTTVKSYASSLEKLGVSVGKDGSLAVDRQKAVKSAEDGSMEKFFLNNSNMSYGFTSRLTQVAENSRNNPAAYINNSVGSWQNSSSSSSSSTSNTNSFFDSISMMTSPYAVSYNRYQNMGFLIDMFI